MTQTDEHRCVCCLETTPTCNVSLDMEYFTSNLSIVTVKHTAGREAWGSPPKNIGL